MRLHLSALLFALLPVFAAAHNAPGSAVFFEFHAATVTAELRLPLSELAVAFGAPLADQPDRVLPAHDAALRAYVLRHLALTAPDGRPWRLAVTGLAVAAREEPADLVVHLALTPPAGAPAREFRLRYDVVSHEVMNHYVQVAVRRDWRTATFPDQPETLGTLRSFLTELSVQRPTGSLAHGAVVTLTRRLDRLAPGAVAGGLLAAGGLLFVAWRFRRAVAAGLQRTAPGHASAPA